MHSAVLDSSFPQLHRFTWFYCIYLPLSNSIAALIIATFCCWSWICLFVVFVDIVLIGIYAGSWSIQYRFSYIWVCSVLRSNRSSRSGVKDKIFAFSLDPLLGGITVVDWAQTLHVVSTTITRLTAMCTSHSSHELHNVLLQLIVGGVTVGVRNDTVHLLVALFVSC